MIGVGIIGVGRAGLIHARNFVNKVAHSRLVALCDPHEETLANAAKSWKSSRRIRIIAGSSLMSGWMR